MSGQIVASRRASMDVPAPGLPSISTIRSESLHHVQLPVNTWGNNGPPPIWPSFTIHL